MAAFPVVVVDEDGHVEIPKELRGDPRYQGGARLQLVPIASMHVSDEERIRAWDNFIKLRGVFADSDFDPNAERAKERERELAKEAAWLHD